MSRSRGEVSLAARWPHWPAFFNPSSPNTESLNQGLAVFSTSLMYRRKSGWSAKPPGTGNHVACRVLGPSGHCVHCPAFGLDVPDDRNRNQRACALRRDQEKSEITEYRNGRDSWTPAEVLAKKDFLCINRNSWLFQKMTA